MKDNSEDTFKMIGIIRNATVIYKDNVKEKFEVLRVIDNGVIIGRIMDDKFMDCGFISKGNIKEIKNGRNKKIPRMK